MPATDFGRADAQIAVLAPADDRFLGFEAQGAAGRGTFLHDQSYVHCLPIPMGGPWERTYPFAPDLKHSRAVQQGVRQRPAEKARPTEDNSVGAASVGRSSDWTGALVQICLATISVAARRLAASGDEGAGDSRHRASLGDALEDRRQFESYAPVWSHACLGGHVNAVAY